MFLYYVASKGVKELCISIVSISRVSKWIGAKRSVSEEKELYPASTISLNASAPAFQKRVIYFLGLEDIGDDTFTFSREKT